MRTRDQEREDGTLKLVPMFDYRDPEWAECYERRIRQAFDYLRAENRLEMKALRRQSSL